jgi:hypothetical protein
MHQITIDYAHAQRYFGELQSDGPCTTRVLRNQKQTTLRSRIVYMALLHIGPFIESFGGITDDNVS